MCVVAPETRMPRSRTVSYEAADGALARREDVAAHLRAERVVVEDHRPVGEPLLLVEADVGAPLSCQGGDGHDEEQPGEPPHGPPIIRPARLSPRPPSRGRSL